MLIGIISWDLWLSAKASPSKGKTGPVLGSRFFVWGEGVSSGQGGDTLNAAANGRIYAGYNAFGGKLGGGFYADGTFVGKDETGFGLGLRGEVGYGAFFFEASYGRFAEQYQSRAIISRAGSELGFMLGLRGAIAKRVLIESGIAQSTKSYDTEDGEAIGSSLSKSMIAPVIGIDFLLGSGR
jgi:hypothetical protein